MKPLFYLAIALIALPILCSAQSNYKPGYFINLKGDTIRGAINYQEWDNNPPSFQFKTTATTTPANITTKQARYVDVTGLESYESYVGYISTDATDFQHISNGRDTSFKTDTVFLKVLQRGKYVTLYSYSDDLKTRFFVSETGANTDPIELTYRLYYDHNNTRGTVSENTYMRQLFALAIKYNPTNESISGKIERAEYKRVDLLKIVSEINQVTPPKLKDESKLHYFIGAGANIGMIKTLTPGSTNNPTHTSVMPLLSGGFDILTNPNTGRLIFRIEGLVTANKFESSITTTSTTTVTLLRYSFTQLNFILNPQVVYNLYDTHKFKFYLSPGLVVSYVKFIDEDYNLTLNGGAPIALNPVFPFENFLLTCNAKAGIKLNNRFDIYTSYQIPVAITTDQDPLLRLSSVYLGMHYFFGK